MTGARRTTGWIAAVVGVAVLFAGCGDDNDSSTSEESSGGMAATEEAIEFQDAPAPEGEPLTVERRIIYTANMVVRVDDVEEAAAEAVQIADDAGGLLFSQDLDLEGDREGSLTLKVPPDADQLDSIMESLGELGDPVDSQLSANDVTAAAVDLEGRLASAQASADRLRTLLAEAANTTDLVTIEGELARRESEIESLEGQLRVLNEQTDMATIDVRFTEDEDDGLPGFVDAIGSGLGVLVSIVKVVILVAAFLLPFVALLLLVWGVRSLRARRRRPPATPGGGGDRGSDPSL